MRRAHRGSTAPAALLQTLQSLSLWRKVCLEVCWSTLRLLSRHAAQVLVRALCGSAYAWLAVLQDSKKLPAAREELLRMVVDGSSDQARARELVEQLVDERAPFDESLLGGGPWQAGPLKHRLGTGMLSTAAQLCDQCATQVVYSSGPLLWQAFTALGNVFSARRLGRGTNKARCAPA